jgi:ABC-type transport system involved in multi-copper enzyme maturation permease subunit
MYFWKCWRDSRSRFVVSVIILQALCVFFSYMEVNFAFGAMRGGPPSSVSQTWSHATSFVLGGVASLFTLLCGLVMGASGLGEEFKERTADFLLVRPRRRSYWVWTGWSVGVLELSVMVFLAAATTFGTLTCLTGHLQTWWPLATAMPLALGGAVAYGLTYFMTVVARNGLQGLSYGFVIFFIDLLLPVAASYYYPNVNLPSVLGFMLAACQWVAGAPKAFPTGSLVLWTAIALAFPFAAQLVLERAEV